MRTLCWCDVSTTLVECDDMHGAASSRASRSSDGFACLVNELSLLSPLLPGGLSSRARWGGERAGECRRGGGAR